MARKRQEIALQAEIETQEEWEEMLSKEGLTVVDIYQEWAGPCKGIVSNLKRLKNELGDDLLRFSVAKSDTVDSLERYRGHCEPCFLFFAGGILVAQVRGADAPVLQRTITEQLSYEHKVLEGTAERKEIKDQMLIDVESDKEDEDDDEEAEQKKNVTVAIIKPNVVSDGKVDEIIEQMKESGIEVLEQQEKTLTEEEAREFYSHKKDEEYFEDLISFMTSGPSHVLVLTKGSTGEGIIEEWREMLGPPSVEDARQDFPESLRAKYGGEASYVNALHGSDSQDTATRELAFFFPGFVQPTIPRSPRAKKIKVQRTLALIRPDALREKKDEILEKIEQAGFKVALQKEITLSKEQAEEFYKEHRDQEYFEELTTRMSSGPLLALGLAREEAVTGWRELLGPQDVKEAKENAPESLRAQFSIEEVELNQLHGSDSEDTAKSELEYFFPMQQTVAVIKPDAYQTKDEIMDKMREAGFHIAARKETELTKEIAEQLYKDHKDKEYFNDLTDHMASGPTLFVVLSREDAVEGWRSIIGPTDPEKAKEEAPDSLRAQFGKDLLSNAIHGSSNPEHAKDSIKLIFGDLEFQGDGSVVQEGGVEDEQEEDKEQAEDDRKDTDEGRKEEEDGQKDEERRSPSLDDRAKSPKDDRPKSSKDEDRSESPKGDEERSKSPKDEDRGKSPKDEDRAKSPKDEDRAKSPKDEDRAKSPKDDEDKKSTKGDHGDDDKKSMKGDDDKKSTKGDDDKKSTKGDDDKKSMKGDDDKKSMKGDDDKKSMKGDDDKKSMKGDDDKKSMKGDDDKKSTKGDDAEKTSQKGDEEDRKSQKSPVQDDKQEEDKKEDDQKSVKSEQKEEEQKDSASVHEDEQTDARAKSSAESHKDDSEEQDTPAEKEVEEDTISQKGLGGDDKADANSSKEEQEDEEGGEEKKDDADKKSQSGEETKEADDKTSTKGDDDAAKTADDKKDDDDNERKDQ